MVNIDKKLYRWTEKGRISRGQGEIIKAQDARMQMRWVLVKSSVAETDRKIVVDLVTQSRHLVLSRSLWTLSERSPPHNRISTKAASIKVIYTRALTSKLPSLHSLTAPCTQGLSSQFSRWVTQFFMMPAAINHFCFGIQYGRLLKPAVFGTTDFTRPNKSRRTEAGNCLWSIISKLKRSSRKGLNKDIKASETHLFHNVMVINLVALSQIA